MKTIGILVALLVCCGGASAQLADGLYAAFDTSMGSFTCRLDYAEAPVTCANFAGLAEGSQHWIDPTTGSIQNDPFYDDLIFHRVITNFMIQGGCPLGNGTSGPGYAFPDEFDPDLTHSGTGILSMANSGPDSGGSQFFITLTNTTWLNNKHAVFGEVVDGMDVVFSIGAVDVDASRPLVDVAIEQINILRIGTDAENFDPLTQPLPEVIPLPLGISNTTSGLVVSVTASNLCKDAVYEKSTLTAWVDWSPIETNYWQTGGEVWTTPTATNQPTQFFKGTRIFHPQATTAFIEGHTLSLTLGADTVVLQPEEGGGGSCSYSYNGTSGDITEWGFEPAYCSYYFDTTILLPLSFEFQYTTPTNGIYNGFYRHSTAGWQPISGTFTDAPGQ